jgi:hypothetical protein
MSRRKRNEAEAIEITPTKQEKPVQETVEEKALVPVDSRDLAAYGEIDDETVDVVIHAGADNVNWCKNTAGGFIVNDRVLREVEGRIVYMYPHLIFWKDQTPTKVPDPGDGQPMPEGFERRVDLHVLTSDNFLLGISIPQSSYRRNFSGYIQSLRNMGRKPDQVITKFTCKERKARDRSFPSVEASFIGEACQDDVPF